jgi:uncharacterized Ntn-hydrolase superfamily protein
VTFSITATAPETGATGVAIASVFPSVGAVCPWANDRVALSTQAWDSGADYGDPLLEMAARGIGLESAAEAVLANRSGSAGTQLHGTAADGETYAYTGEKATEWAGHVIGDNHTAAGNTLSGESVVTEMHDAFVDTAGPLAERLLTALTAGERAGGDKRGDNLSAAVLVHVSEPELSHNMRVDQPGDPIDGLWDAYEAAREHAAAVEDTEDLAAEWGEGFNEEFVDFQIKY